MDSRAELTPSQQAELEHFLQVENQRAMLNELVTKIAGLCFDKCVGTPGKSMSSGESSCLSNCALRYLDTSSLIMQRMGHAASQPH